jgi:hypothetical protein
MRIRLRGKANMRTQVTVYLAPDRKAWLKRYAQKHGFKESELIHWLIERERNVRWLERSLRETDAPAQAIAPKPKTGRRRRKI